ncbi:hypothetical protein DPMN_057767 [Dreissena polymorpha]|uniref:Uncharacterized protein n=1 Tax=Dreissena polymorpha TaxID=45954 RepID=A0A9D4C0V8_DREPO|nr:hypothetical protein DPMN_057767 [Dreissena polymorpha]
MTTYNIIATNLLTKKNARPPGSHFHEGRTVNVASRVLTRFYNSHIRKNAPPLGSHVFQANNYFQTYPRFIETNLLTKFHEDWTINVASRVLTKKNAPPLVAIVLTKKNALPPWWPCFSTNWHQLVQDIIGMNLLTEFYYSHIYIDAALTTDAGLTIHTKKTSPPPGGNVFPLITSIFKLVRDIHITNAKNVTCRIRETNVLTKFHEDLTKNVTSRVENCPAPPGDHVWTKFHDDWAKIVTSRVFTRNTAPPPGGHLHEDWASNVTSTVFELSRGINGTNVLTKFHEDWTIKCGL